MAKTANAITATAANICSAAKKMGKEEKPNTALYGLYAAFRTGSSIPPVVAIQVSYLGDVPLVLCCVAGLFASEKEVFSATSTTSKSRHSVLAPRLHVRKGLTYVKAQEKATNYA